MQARKIFNAAHILLLLCASTYPARAQRETWNPLEHDDYIDVPPVEPPPLSAEELEAARMKPAQAGVQDDGSLIDLLIICDNRASAHLGSVNEVINRAQLELNLLNVAYANSLDPQRARIVHIECVPYDGADDSVQSLNWAQSSPIVGQLRDQYGADLVVLFTSAIFSCGIGFQMTPQYVGPQMAPYGYLVIDVSCDGDGNFIMAHEVGHNSGAHHHDEVGAFPYSSGYRVVGGWKDIMAYPCPPPGDCQEAPVFSSPLVTYGGQVMGTSMNDNARTLNETRFVVANFRQTVIPVNTVVTGKVTKSGSPVESATVHGAGNSWTATVADGTYSLSTSPGQQTITANKNTVGDEWCYGSVQVNAVMAQITAAPDIQLLTCITLDKKLWLPLVVR